MKSWVIAMIVGLLVVFAACAPKATPAPATATLPPSPTTLKDAPALSPEEAAWQKVMAAAKKEGRLTSYSYLMIADTGLAMKSGFKKATGLDIDIITSTGAVLIERIKAERRGGFPVASILDTSSVLLIQAKMEGLTQSSGLLPELENKQAWKQDPPLDKEGHILVPNVLFQSPWINTKLVRPEEEPKSLRELLQPKWRGKISVPDPDTDPTSVRVYYHMAKKAGILDDAYFRELGKASLLFPNVRMNAEAVARGEAAISFVSTASSMGPFVAAGAPVKAIDVEEGVIALRTPGISLLSQAPQPNATKVFINWWLSREGQHTFHEAYGTESLRKDVPNFTPLPARLTPRKVLWESAEDANGTALMQRERAIMSFLRLI